MALQERAKQALDKAVDFVLSQQHSDGGWAGENFAGPAYTAMCLCVEAYLGILSDRDKAAGVKYCLSTQLADGSYPDYPMATMGSRNTTALIYAAMSLCDVEASSAAQQKALAYVNYHGGFDQVDYEYKLYLAMAGLYSSSNFASPTVLFKFLPFSQKIIGSRFGLEMAIAANELPLVVRLLKNGPGLRWWAQPLQSLGCYLSYKYLLKTQNPAGNWAGILMPTLWAMLGMHYAGINKQDSAWTNAVSYLSVWKVYDASGMRVIPYQSRLWNTALMLRALMFSESSVAEAAVKKGLAYLLANQSNQLEPIGWQNPAKGAPRTGGWPYEEGNPKCSDCDTTAAVLWTLAEAKKRPEFDTTLCDQLSSAITKGKAWLLGMQNSDGGWAAFCHGLAAKPAGPMFVTPFLLPEPSLSMMTKLMLKPPIEMGDPSTAGLTGRVTCALAAMGLQQQDEVCQKASQFLMQQKADNGAWWGRWEVNYLAASGCVVNGLSALAHSPESDALKPALNWMQTKQNDDGGWGEAIDSYANPALAGEGPSSAIVTAEVIESLLAADLDNDGVTNGITYLIDEQTENGSWDETQPLYVMIPPNTFYTNLIYSQYSPIVALSRYLGLLDN